jgi:catalase
MLPDAPGPVGGRTVGVLVGPGVDGRGAESLRTALEAAGLSMYVIAPKGGKVEAKRGTLDVDRTVLTTDSVEYDALVVAGGDSAAELTADPWTAVNLGEAFRHHKTIGAWGEGSGVLDTLGLTGPGIVTAASASKTFAKDLITAIGWHRHWDRVPVAAR